MRVLIDDAAPGVRNMAVDEALMRAVAVGGLTTLRFYRWAPGCLSFGRNQEAIGAYDGTLAASRGIDVVRRPTGGRAVYHDRELTYAVAAPADAWGTLRTAYCRINRALAAGLRGLGVPAGCAGEAPGAPRAPLPSARACFRDPLPGEVIAGGRKLIGSAQWRDGGAFLQHGSLLLEDDQGMVEEFRTRRDDGSRDADSALGDTGAAALSEFCSVAPSLDDLVSAIRNGFTTEFSIASHLGEATPAENEASERLEEHYADPQWTWRR